VPSTALVTVITNEPRGFCSRRITISELAQIRRGRNPRHRRLFDRRNGLGFWIRATADTVRSLDQQYQP
jgi:hypothetical protein